MMTSEVQGLCHRPQKGLRPPAAFAGQAMPGLLCEYRAKVLPSA